MNLLSIRLDFTVGRILSYSITYSNYCPGQLFQTFASSHAPVLGNVSISSEFSAFLQTALYVFIVFIPIFSPLSVILAAFTLNSQAPADHGLKLLSDTV